MQPQPEVFNLVYAPWLPVRRRSGAIERIPPWRINDGIAEDPFVAFAWPRPDFDGAAHEFMIGLLSTAAAPEDDDEWEDWWSCPPAPDVLERKFAPLAHAFCLDGSGPRFMQDLDPLDDADNKEVATLLIDAPGSQTLRNNADLFVKRGNAPVLCRAAAAMALYTLNSYAPSGGAGHRTSLRGGGPMTTLVVAEHHAYNRTLWGRLWPNVETRKQIEDRATDAYPQDDFASMFPWLVPTRLSNPKTGGRETTQADIHPLQVYWGMPRRIHLLLGEGRERTCSLTDVTDQLMVTHYRTKNYGINYSEGFEHPLTPYYRVKSGSAKMPFHPKPGGVNYRLWPGLVVSSRDRLRQPAQVIRKWPERSKCASTRFTAFGYDMDNMKARNWVESEWPIWLFENKDMSELFAYFIGQITAGSSTVSWSLTSAVKSALYDNPSDARGDYGFIAERFYRETEDQFYFMARIAADSIISNTDVDDPTLEARKKWMPIMATAALQLFDEYAPTEGLEDRNMHRHVKARFFLVLVLRGQGKFGRSLYGGDLEIPLPETVVAKKESS